MNVQKISAHESRMQNPAFKASYVTLCQKNLGREIAVNVVDSFNSTILPEVRRTVHKGANAIIKASGGPGRVIASPKDFQDKVNFFALAGGSGSRFKELAETVGPYNKISLPFRIGGGKNIHMLDFAMTMGKYFIGKEGVNKIIAQTPSGSFGDIVAYYQAGNPIKDTVVCCGDNVFGDKASDMMSFFTKAINDPFKHVALVGVARKPEEVAGRFGVLEVEGSLGDKVLKLKGFSEKPPIEEAQKLAVDGENVANTGMFYISKEAMACLMDEINRGVNNIKKSDAEPYDFANAVKYVHSKLPDWFGIASTEGADVKVVKQWEDVGEPKALYQFANDVREGSYLQNFPNKLANRIRSAFINRVRLDAKVPYIDFTEDVSVFRDVEPSVVFPDQIKRAPTIEGVKIIV